MKLQRTLNPSLGLLLLLPVAGVAANLVLFLFLGGGFLLQPGVAVKVPNSPFLLAPQHNPCVVSITGAPMSTIYFNNRRMDTSELGVSLSTIRNATRSLIIKADRQAPAELIVQVFNTAIAQNFSVVLATSEK